MNWPFLVLPYHSPPEWYFLLSVFTQTLPEALAEAISASEALLVGLGALPGFFAGAAAAGAGAAMASDLAAGAVDVEARVAELPAAPAFFDFLDFFSVVVVVGSVAVVVDPV